jgi:HK97 family phage portal protein
MGTLQDRWHARRVETREAAAPTLTDIGPRAMSRGRPDYASGTNALAVAAVYRCASILTTLASSLDIVAMRVGRPLINQPSLVRRPNLDEPRRVTIQTTVAAMALYGECVWLTPRSSFAETPAQITIPLLSDIHMTCDNRRRPVYEDTTHVLRPYEYQHLKLFRIPGALHGLGPIQAARMAVQGAGDLEEYAGQWFGENEIPEGILTTDQHLSQTQAQSTADMWREQRAQNKTAVMGNGVKYTPLLLNPADAMFVDVHKLRTVQVAMLMGVPATMLDAPSADSAVYANQSQKNQQLLDLTLRCYLGEIEGAWGELLPLGTTARFSTSELLRLNEKERAETNEILIRSGQRTANECRADDGLDPINAPAPVAVNPLA